MQMPTSIQQFQESWDSFRATIGFEEISDTLGLVPHSCGENTMSMSMELAPHLRQAGGMFSATALFGAADLTGTFLAMQATRLGSFPLAVQSNLNFLSNSLEGPVIATAQLLRVGGSTIVASVEVSDRQGKLLVASTFTYLSKANTSST